MCNPLWHCYKVGKFVEKVFLRKKMLPALQHQCDHKDFYNTFPAATWDKGRSCQLWGFPWQSIRTISVKVRNMIEKHLLFFCCLPIGKTITYIYNIKHTIYMKEQIRKKCNISYGVNIHRADQETWLLRDWRYNKWDYLISINQCGLKLVISYSRSSSLNRYHMPNNSISGHTWGTCNAWTPSRFWGSLAPLLSVPLGLDYYQPAFCSKCPQNGTNFINAAYKNSFFMKISPEPLCRAPNHSLRSLFVSLLA